MVAKRGTKRGAVSALDEMTTPQKSQLEGVEEGIKRAKQLPDACREMILAALPASVSTTPDSRHEVQAMVVNWVGEIMQGVESDMQSTLAAEQAAVATADEVKERVKAKVSEAGTRQADAIEAVKSKTAAVADFKKAVSVAEAAVTEGEATLAAGETSLERTRQAKEQVQAIMEKDVKAIVEGQAGAHYKNCLPIVESLGLDDSLRTALPSACAKIPSDRGTFDTMVVSQLETSFSNKLAYLVQALAEEEAAQNERAATLEDARKRLAESKNILRRAQDVLSAAQGKEREAIDGAKAAQAAMEQYEPECKRTTASRDARAEALRHFQQYNMTSFQILRDGVTEAAPEPETQAAVAPAMKTVSEAETTTANVVVAGA